MVRVKAKKGNVAAPLPFFDTTNRRPCRLLRISFSVSLSFLLAFFIYFIFLLSMYNVCRVSHHQVSIWRLMSF